MNAWVQLSKLVKGPVTAGGVCKMWAIPVDWIFLFPKFNPTTQYLDGDIVTAWKKYWFAIDLPASGKGFEEASKESNGRSYWEQTFSFRIYWQSGQTDVKIANMLHHRWIFLFKEAGTGMYYVVGMPPVGAQLQVVYKNAQGTITEFKGIAQSTHRAPLYTGVNRSAKRLVDTSGNPVVDDNGDYLYTIGEMIVPSVEGDFSREDFTENEFYVR